MESTPHKLMPTRSRTAFLASLLTVSGMLWMPVALLAPLPEKDTTIELERLRSQVDRNRDEIEEFKDLNIGARVAALEARTVRIEEDIHSIHDLNLAILITVLTGLGSLIAYCWQNFSRMRKSLHKTMNFLTLLGGRPEEVATVLKLLKENGAHGST